MFIEKYAQKDRILEGEIDEYIKRHNEIWPEMVKELKRAGIYNHTIWNSGNDLFGYYECDCDEYKSDIKQNNAIIKNGMNICQIY